MENLAWTFNVLSQTRKRFLYHANVVHLRFRWTFKPESVHKTLLCPPSTYRVTYSTQEFYLFLKPYIYYPEMRSNMAHIWDCIISNNVGALFNHFSLLAKSLNSQQPMGLFSRHISPLLSIIAQSETSLLIRIHIATKRQKSLGRRTLS